MFREGAEGIVPCKVIGDKNNLREIQKFTHIIFNLTNITDLQGGSPSKFDEIKFFR